MLGRILKALFISFDVFSALFLGLISFLLLANSLQDVVLHQGWQHFLLNMLSGAFLLTGAMGFAGSAWLAFRAGRLFAAARLLHLAGGIAAIACAVLFAWTWYSNARCVAAGWCSWTMPREWPVAVAIWSLMSLLVTFCCPTPPRIPVNDRP